MIIFVFALVLCIPLRMNFLLIFADKNILSRFGRGLVSVVFAFAHTFQQEIIDCYFWILRDTHIYHLFDIHLFVWRDLLLLWPISRIVFQGFQHYSNNENRFECSWLMNSSLSISVVNYIYWFFVELKMPDSTFKWWKENRNEKKRERER